MRPTIEELMDRNTNHLPPQLPPFLHQNSQNDVEAASAINNHDNGYSKYRSLKAFRI